MANAFAPVAKIKSRIRCADCRFFSDEICGHEKSARFDPIYGQRWTSAKKIRADSISWYLVGACGPEGKLFEPRQATPPAVIRRRLIAGLAIAAVLFLLAWHPWMRMI